MPARPEPALEIRSASPPMLALRNSATRTAWELRFPIGGGADVVQQNWGWFVPFQPRTDRAWLRYRHGAARPCARGPARLLAGPSPFQIGGSMATIEPSRIAAWKGDIVSWAEENLWVRSPETNELGALKLLEHQAAWLREATRRDHTGRFARKVCVASWP